MEPDRRIKITMAVIGFGVVLFAGFGYLAARQTQPPPIVITSPSGDPPPPISGATGSASANSLTAAQPAPTVQTTLPESASAEPTAGPGGPPNNAPPMSTTPSSAPAKPTQPASLAVDVAGAVKYPTVYYLRPGSRVQQAVHAAGGPTADADLDQVNLAENVTDGEKVYIPHRGQDTAVPQDIGNTIGLESSEAAGSTPLATSGRGSTRHGHSGSNKLSSPADGQIDLNTASADDLQQIPGIGPSMAARIIAFRSQNGPFRSIDDLRQVTGVGEKKLARWSPFLVVR